MIEKNLDTERLIPTDSVRNPKTILDVIPLYAHGRDAEVPPIHVIPYKSAEEEKYLICSGNHRAASAHICHKPIRCRILTEEADLSEILEGSAREYKTLRELHDGGVDSAKKHLYLSKGWDEYFRDMFSQSIMPDF